MNRPQRLLSLSPNVSMILFALGADDLVIGRTQYCLSSIQHYLEVWKIDGPDIPQRLQHWTALPEVGAWPHPETERVIALQADFILASGTGTLNAYEAASFKIEPDQFLNFDVRSLADLDGQIATLGELVGKTDVAGKLTTKLAAWRDTLCKRLDTTAHRPTVLFEYCVCIKYDPDPTRRFANPGRFIMVGGHLAPDLIQLSGGEALFAQPGDAVAWTEFEAIHEAQPDMILLFDCSGCPNALTHPVETRPGWSELSAVANHHVYTLHKNIANPTLCYPDALEELVELVDAWRQSSNRQP